MDWKIIISKVENGFLMEIPEEEKDENGVIDITIRKKVIEFVDDAGPGEDTEEKEGLTRLFTEIAEHFGIMHQKYSKSNLNIKWNLHGSKADD